MPDVAIRYVGGLPSTIRAFTTIYEDIYCIYVNGDLPQTTIKSALDHELKHIKNGDFQNNFGIYDIEK